jgi:hypothetical protein
MESLTFVIWGKDNIKRERIGGWIGRLENIAQSTFPVIVYTTAPFHLITFSDE